MFNYYADMMFHIRIFTRMDADHSYVYTIILCFIYQYWNNMYIFYTFQLT